MASLSSIIATLLLVSLAYESGARAQKDAQGDAVLWDRINDYLEKHCQSFDASDNIAAAREWLANNVHDVQKDLQLVDAINAFVALSDLGDKNEAHCNWQLHELLKRNDDATRGKAHVCRTKLQGKPALRRVEQVIHYFATEHAKNCAFVLAKQLARDAPACVDKLVDHSVDAFYKEILGARMLDSPQFETITITPLVRAKYAVEHVDSVATKGDYSVVYYMLRGDLARDDPEVEFLRRRTNEHSAPTERAKVVQMLDRYVLQPCKAYKAALEHIVVPIDYNLNMLGTREFMLKYEEIAEPWAKYRVCNILIQDDYEKLSQQLADYVDGKLKFQMTH